MNVAVGAAPDVYNIQTTNVAAQQRSCRHKEGREQPHPTCPRFGGCWPVGGCWQAADSLAVQGEGLGHSQISVTVFSGRSALRTEQQWAPFAVGVGGMPYKDQRGPMQPIQLTASWLLQY